jgi:hypothetical protein
MIHTVGWLIGAGAAALSVHLLYPTERTHGGPLITATAPTDTSQPTHNSDSEVAAEAATSTAVAPHIGRDRAYPNHVSDYRSRMITIKPSALESLAYGNPSAGSMLVVLMTDITLLQSSIDYFYDHNSSGGTRLSAQMTV